MGLPSFLCWFQERKMVTPRGPIDEEKINPFDVAPNAFDENTFKMKNPLVVLRGSERLLSFDIIGNPKMNEDALHAAVEKIMTHAQICRRTFKTPKTERGCQITHASFLTGLWCVTQPSCDPDTCNDASDIQVEIGEGKVTEYGPRTSTCSDQSIDEQIEEATDEGRAGTGRSDYKVFVHNNVLSKRKTDLDNAVDAWCCVLAIENKWSPHRDDAIYQVAEYGVRAAHKDVQKGKVSPIYLQVWSKNTWTYAILDVYGYVEIKAGSITSKSFHRFEEQEIERWNRVMGGIQFQKSVFNREGLQGRLGCATKCLKENSCLKTYPDGKYLVACLHTSDKEYTLPNFNEESGAWTEGARLFYEALLRIVVGDRVCSWTVDDVTRAYKVRERMIVDEWKRAFGRDRSV